MRALTVSIILSILSIIVADSNEDTYPFYMDSVEASNGLFYNNGCYTFPDWDFFDLSLKRAFVNIFNDNCFVLYHAANCAGDGVYKKITKLAEIDDNQLLFTKSFSVCTTNRNLLGSYFNQACKFWFIYFFCIEINL